MTQGVRGRGTIKATPQLFRSQTSSAIEKVNISSRKRAKEGEKTVDLGYQFMNNMVLKFLNVISFFFFTQLLYFVRCS